jgi:hypothetical protein
VWLYIFTTGKPFRVSKVKTGTTVKYTDASFTTFIECFEAYKSQELDFFQVTASESSFRTLIEKLVTEGIIFLIPEEKERKRNRVYSWEFSKDQLWEWLKLDKESQILADYLLDKQKNPNVTDVKDVNGLTLEELDSELAEIEKRRVLLEEQKTELVRKKILSYLQDEFALTKEEGVKYLS